MILRPPFTPSAMCRLIGPALSLSLALCSHAGTFSSSTTAPVVHSTDIANLGAQTGSDKWFFQTGDEADPADAAKGQTFITGTSAMQLKALTYKISGGNMKGAPNDLPAPPRHRVRHGLYAGRHGDLFPDEQYGRPGPT